MNASISVTSPALLLLYLNQTNVVLIKDYQINILYTSFLARLSQQVLVVNSVNRVHHVLE